MVCGEIFWILGYGIQKWRLPFLPSLSSSLWKEAETREASTDPGDPSLLMPSLPATSWELAQLSCTSRRVYPAICTACKEAKVPNSSQGLARDSLCSGWETEQRWSSSLHTFQHAVPKRGAACSWVSGWRGVKMVCGAQSCCSIRALGLLVNLSSQAEQGTQTVRGQRGVVIEWGELQPWYVLLLLLFTC